MPIGGYPQAEWPWSHGLADTRVKDYSINGLDGLVHIVKRTTFSRIMRSPRMTAAPPSLRSCPGATPLPVHCWRVVLYPIPAARQLFYSKRRSPRRKSRASSLVRTGPKIPISLDPGRCERHAALE